MPKRIALGSLAVGSPLLLLSFFLGGRAGEWIFVPLSLAFPPALIAIGAARAGRLGRAGIVLLVLGILLEAAGAAILLLAGRPPTERTFLGLSPAAALMLYGMGLLPLILVSASFAATFDPTSSDENPR